MRTLLLVRHGETDWGLSGRYQGRQDIALNDLGRRNVARLARRLRNVVIDHAFTSPLERAVETAKSILRGRNMTLSLIPSFAEMNLGDWEGLDITGIKRRHAEVYRSWEQSPWSVRVPGGETLEEVKSRVWQVLTSVLMASQGVVLLSGHAFVNKVALGILSGAEAADLFSGQNQPYASCHIVEIMPERLLSGRCCVASRLISA